MEEKELGLLLRMKLTVITKLRQQFVRILMKMLFNRFRIL